VEHSKGKGGERVVAILRFQCGSRRLCQLRTASFGPGGQALSSIDYMSGFTGPVNLVS
jgi:hypothetical protein